MNVNKVLASLLDQAREKDRPVDGDVSSKCIEDAKNLRCAAHILQGLLDLISKYEEGQKCASEL